MSRGDVCAQSLLLHETLRLPLLVRCCMTVRCGSGGGGGGAQPQYANYWAPLTRKRHIPPHPAQPLHINHRAPRTRREEQVTVQGPVTKQQPDGMSHAGVFEGISARTKIE